MDSPFLDDRIQPPGGKGVYSARPMTPAEVDAHPDAGRIWATILEIREDYDRQMEAVAHLIAEAKRAI